MPESRRQRASRLPMPSRCVTVLLSAALVLAACGKRPTRALAATESHPAASVAVRNVPHLIRLTGTVQAVHSFVVQTPSIRGQGGNLTLTKLVPGGATVRQGDILAEFDPTSQLQAERDTEAKFDDLKHQIEQKIAEQRSNAEGRASQLQQAEGDLEKARLEIKKGPILSAIDDQKNAAKLEDAQQHAASLRRSNHFHDIAEAAELRVLELQRDRQQVALERARGNMEKLTVRAPLGGMVALENMWKNGSMGHAREGDQLWPGSPLLRIFDPSQMEVRLTVSEPDNAVLKPGMEGAVHVDAYPDQSFRAVFDSAAPVASSALDSPVKTFDARFRFESHDAHLLPDLSAAVDVEAPGGAR
ncbi:MAG: efflux RND transporter periplasmic adaptor subunit [Bryobacteraceae bacterium]|jgi:multidrug efflux pump subunit AcrA (membrane-fusion protein)